MEAGSRLPAALAIPPTPSILKELEVAGCCSRLLSSIQGGSKIWKMCSPRLVRPKFKPTSGLQRAPPLGWLMPWKRFSPLLLGYQRHSTIPHQNGPSSRWLGTPPISPRLLTLMALGPQRKSAHILGFPFSLTNLHPNEIILETVARIHPELPQDMPW